VSLNKRRLIIASAEADIKAAEGGRQTLNEKEKKEFHFLPAKKDKRMTCSPKVGLNRAIARMQRSLSSFSKPKRLRYSISEGK
jgi:aminopeptidase-like protein